MFHKSFLYLWGGWAGIDKQQIYYSLSYEGKMSIVKNENRYMEYCEKMFKFPYRIYEESNIPVLDDIIVSQKDKKWVVGNKNIFIKDILSISDTFYLDSDIDDIIKSGFDASLIITHSEIYSCEWPLYILEKKINEHVKKLKEAKDKKREQAKSKDK